MTGWIIGFGVVAVFSTVLAFAACKASGDADDAYERYRVDRLKRQFEADYTGEDKSHCCDVAWYGPSELGAIAFSSLDVKDSIQQTADKYPRLTISQLQEKFPLEPRAQKVLQQYIAFGYGDRLASKWFSPPKAKTC